MRFEAGRKIVTVDLGRVDYKTAWDIQRRVFQLRQDGQIADTLLFVEHNPVYTFGKNSDKLHLLMNEEELRRSHAEVFHVERGGDVTYHGPGQVVGYPIIDLRNHNEDLHRYLRDLEEVILRSLLDFGVEGSRDKEFTGVWVGNEKIAAIGVKTRQWVTMHGFALNINTDLSYFDRIIPCGIFHKGVTSLHRLLRREIDLREVRKVLTRHFADVFCAQFTILGKESFFEYLETSELERNTWLHLEHQQHEQ